MGQRKVASRSAQWPLLAEFVFQWDDTLIDTTGAARDFKTVGGPFSMVIIPLPPGAIVQGGEVVTEQAWAGGTMTISIGDTGPAVVPAVPVPARYYASAAVTAAARTLLVPTGYLSQGENITMTFTVGTGAMTAGRTSVKVSYVIRDRANEVNPT